MPKVGNAVSMVAVLFSILAPRNKEEVAVRDDKNLEKTWREIAAKVSKGLYGRSQIQQVVVFSTSKIQGIHLGLAGANTGSSTGEWEGMAVFVVGFRPKGASTAARKKDPQHENDLAKEKRKWLE